jgi:DNA-binding transcriptional LysR family regulator
VRDLPPLSALRAFEAVARTGSVTRAAEELHRTHGAVSRQLQILQEHAGVELFEKKGTGLVLSRHGQALYAVAQPVFDNLELGYRQVRRAARGAGIHVACSATFAMRWLVPKLGDFYRRRPDIRIQLSMTSAREIRTEGADLVIDRSWRPYPSHDRKRAIWLAPVAVGPVQAPGYRPGKRGGTRIGHDYIADAWERWEHWEEHSGYTLAWQREITFPHTHLCIEAALAGLGTALVDRSLVRKELEDGTLVAPYGFVRSDDGLMAVPASGRPLAPDTEVFLDWLKTALMEAGAD